MKNIFGVSHPIPTKYAERIYKDGKTVFVSKKCLSRVSPGDKFIIYESYGAKSYTGWADIKTIGLKKTNSIINKYGKKLMITEDELKKYAKGWPEMNVIEFENFEKFIKPVVPERYVSLQGKYIYEDEFKIISKNNGL